MRSITLSVAGVTVQIEDDSESPPIPTYSFSVGDCGPDPVDMSGIVADESTGLMWSADDVVPKSCTQAKAEQACKDLRLGGFTDWRLPTIKELLTLVDYELHSPAIDTEKFPTCKNAWYWTSTPYAPSSSAYAWFVSFDYGYAGYVNRDGSGALARAVRSVAPGQ